MCKLVSAIITTHNRQQLLLRAVKSVISQTYKNIELIVVDDASDERSDDLLAEYSLQYIYIPKEESKGGNYARNKGILTAKGDYVAFLDDDDYWLPQKIEKQIELISKQSCELVYCGRTIERLLEVEGTEFRDVLPYPFPDGNMKKKILLRPLCCTTTILVSKKALYEVGLFDEDLAFWQDYELTIRLAQITPFYYVHEPLCVYREDFSEKQRLTNQYYGWKRAIKYIHKKHHNLYKTLSIEDRIYVNLSVWFDAFQRCKVSNMKWRGLHYRILIKLFCRIPLRIYNIIHKTN